MTDTVRTQSAILALLADGQAAGSITPQVIRDVVVSLGQHASDKDAAVAATAQAAADRWVSARGQTIDIDYDYGGSIQAALTAAVTSGVATRLLLGSGVHTITSELVIPYSASGAPLVLEAKVPGTQGMISTVIRATAAMRSVLCVSRQAVQLAGIQFDANRQATYGLLCDEAGYSRFRHLSIVHAKCDGVRLHAARDRDAAGTMNDGIVWDGCWIEGNGTLYLSAGITGADRGDSLYKVAAAGTVSYTSGAGTVIGSGTQFTSMGIRPYDFIRIGATRATSVHAQIVSVDSDTQLTVKTFRPGNVWDSTASGQLYAIGVGNGYTEERYGDNNVADFRGGCVRTNGGSGMRFNGLYGPTITRTQVDYNGMYAAEIGTSDIGNPVIATLINSWYTESNVAGPLMLGGAHGISVLAPLQAPAAAGERAYHAFPGGSWGFINNTFAEDDGTVKVIERIGTTGVLDMPVGATQNVVMAGTQTLTPRGNVVLSTGSETIPMDAAIVPLYPLADVTMASGALAAGVEGQIATLVNTRFTGTVTLSVGNAGGTTSPLAIGPAESVTLLWNATVGHWYRLNRITGD